MKLTLYFLDLASAHPHMFSAFPEMLSLLALLSSIETAFSIALLFTTCSRSDLRFFAKVLPLPTLTLPYLATSWLGMMALFLFFLAKEAPAFLPTAYFVVLRSLSPIRQAPFVQSCLRKPAPFCLLFAGVRSTNKTAKSLPSFLSLALSLSLSL